MLADHLQGARRSIPVANESLLAGLIVDNAGGQLIASHACKGGTRYRYYVSQALQRGISGAENSGVRLPAREIENAVVERIAEALGDPLVLAIEAGLDLAADQMLQVTERSNSVAARIRGKDKCFITKLIKQVRVLVDRVEIELHAVVLADLLQLPAGTCAEATFSLASNIRVTRTGRAVRLVQTSGAKVGAPSPHQTLVNLLVKAYCWWGDLRQGHITAAELARREGVIKPYVSRVVRLAFLAPDVVEAILAGRQLASIDGRALKATDAISPLWSEQRRRFLPGR